MKLEEGKECTLRTPSGVEHVHLSELFALGARGWNEQLEHQFPTLPVEKVGEAAEAIGLALVHRPIGLGAIADQHLTERRRELLDVPREVVAVLEVELVLPAPFHGAYSQVPVPLRVAQDARAELLVDQDTRVLLRNASGDGRLESLVDDLLRRNDTRDLLRLERAIPAEQFGRE